jgi:DNA-directed RNA polymerase specialized sigma24 family protein
MSGHLPFFRSAGFAAEKGKMLYNAGGAEDLATITARSNISDQTMAAARSGKRSAVEAVLSHRYARVCRIALALCGREKTGKVILREILDRALDILPSWECQSDADNWFIHYSILACRRVRPDKIDPWQDCLLQRVDHPSPGYQAFIRALRLLPGQQQEAFVLSRGEQLDARPLAIAMDCSTAAAANHLIAAVKSLTAIAGADFQTQATAMGRVYASLTPTDELIVNQIATRVSRHRKTRRLRRILTTIVVIGVLGGTAWIVWKLWGMIVV